MSSGLIALSRIASKKMVQNLVWATRYNVITIPAAAGPFVHLGKLLFR
jgi:cation transport ATPase